MVFEMGHELAEILIFPLRSYSKLGTIDPLDARGATGCNTEFRRHQARMPPWMCEDGISGAPPRRRLMSAFPLVEDYSSRVDAPVMKLAHKCARPLVCHLPFNPLVPFPPIVGPAKLFILALFYLEFEGTEYGFHF